MRFVLIGAVLAGVAVPASGARESVAVPSPPQVLEQPLAAASGGTAGLPLLPKSGQAGPAASGQARVWQFRHGGQLLELTVVQAEGAGLAVLSMPESASGAMLPVVSEAVFREAADKASGCQAEGPVRPVASRRGTVALSAALNCRKTR
ncbi:hypothetical protein [Cribrihabitans neustonicus]|uniref:hypothetical protein n=1 Tax=Cribrihabitans neustonicus TaxID=1429085 RepID=UPI003B59EECA